MRKLLLLSAVVASAGLVAADQDEIRRPKRGRLIQDSYIVVLKEDAAGWAHAPARSGLTVDQVAVDLATRHGGSVTRSYGRALRGFAVQMPEGRARALARDPRVEYVEQDQVMTAVATQSPATWGLDRIDQRNLPLSNSYTYNFTGSGVKAYIIDTGIRRTHSQFGGRAVHGYTAINDGRGSDDCNGHGTHVSGTVGGSTYGVAKSVTLVAVRVLDCNGSGSNSGVIAGVDWVTSNHASGQNAVANMSLGGGASSALDTAVNNSINDGVTYAIAAGNSNNDACGGSPARVAAAITVGSTTSTDARSSFSSWGTCLDIFAPGSSITSSWNTSDTATNTISGTSMATPHVAGAAALYLSEFSGSSPATVRNGLVNRATSGVVTNPGSGSPNRLLYTLAGAPPPPPPPPPSGCEAGYTTYTGSLSGTGDADYQPNGTYYYSGVSGTHSGKLTGTGPDFDLYLYKWFGYWGLVAYSEGTTSTEAINYSGTSGYYLWEIYSYSGSGTYTFCLKKP